MLTCFDDVPHVPCQCFPPGEGCVCDDTERVLRGYQHGLESLAPMTPAQRAALLEEIVQCSEGARREDYAAMSDTDLARATMFAWLDYCRDKGLL